MKKPTRRKARVKKAENHKPLKKVLKKSVKPAQKQAVKKRPLVRHKPVAQSTRSPGIPEKLRDTALQVLDDRQAEEVVTVNLAGRSSVADYLIIASGRGARQVAAIAHYLREAFEKLGVKKPRIEGLPEGNWVVVDAGDVIIHLFLPDVRRYYNIEDIWSREEENLDKASSRRE